MTQKQGESVELTLIKVDMANSIVGRAWEFGL